ncbi:MAG: 4-(cytidine 5'-diphospho)-2-C-methyl-D-erythritol kinase [Nitrospiraceae bacterium]
MPSREAGINRSSTSGSIPIETLRVPAPAKVNLILRVLDRRSDGCHNLWSLMQTVGLDDEIELCRRPGKAEVTLHCDRRELPTNEQNLVFRAAMLVLKRSEIEAGIDIRLTKRIPMGAGLGGGSSDAAAAIAGLNHLFGLQWSARHMAELGQELGSDVPFFFSAPSAIVTGRGEGVTPIRLVGQRWIVLVNPGFSVETRWAYQELAAARTGVRPLSDSLRTFERQTVLEWADVVKASENDFESAVFAVHQNLRSIKERLIAAGAETALLSGSGATVFGVFRDERTATQAREQFIGTPGYVVAAVRACSKGPDFL